MKNGIIRFIGIVICLMVFLGSFCALASEIDFNRKCNLTLTYSKENIGFSDLEIKIYRIAQTCDDGIFEKISPYDSYPVNIEGITSQAEWNEVASTLLGYIQIDAIEPYMVQKTDNEGKAVFDDIEIGLYLVGGTTCEIDGGFYDFYEFMISVPSKSGDTYTYDINAKPKSNLPPSADGEDMLSIVKLWQDEGYSQNRPDSVSVDILKDGIVVETAILNSLNNWTYTFNKNDDKSNWSVVEKNVPKGYTVKINEKESGFVIVNTYTPPDNPPDKPNLNNPQTGDTFPIEFYMVMLCVSGLALVVLGVGMRRKDNVS